MFACSQSIPVFTFDVLGALELESVQLLGISLDLKVLLVTTSIQWLLQIY